MSEAGADPSMPETSDVSRESGAAAINEDGFVSVPPPSRLRVPCAQDAKPVGTRVRRGESLASDAPGPLSPVAGTIAGIENVRCLGGREVRAVIIDVDPGTGPHELPPPASLESVEQALDALRQSGTTKSAANLLAAGIDADRWTSPSLAAQLREPPRRPIDTVLCGALDLDPVLPLQRQLVTTRAAEIAAGVMALAGLTGATRGLLALPEDASLTTVARSRAAAAATGLRLFPLPDEYPTAHPTLLIHRVLGRRLSPRQSPTEAGVLFLDAPAALAVGHFVLHGAPPTVTPLGIYDRGRARAHLAWAPIGSRLADVLAAIGINVASVDLREGHLLRDLPADADAIIAADGELTVLAAESHARPPAAACIRCAWCVEACPVHIHPAGLLEAAQQQDPDLADRHGLRSCIECGICSYVCPSRLPLLPAIRTMIHERSARK